jgi:hypothetical protein
MRKLQPVSDEQRAENIKRFSVAATIQWAARIDEWRRHQPDLPNFSEAIRRLVEAGLESSAKKGGKAGR